MDQKPPEIAQLIEDYLAAWNAPSSEQRDALLSQVLSPDCIYADSHFPDLVETRELHSQFIGQFRSKLPDLTMSLRGTPDAHHDYFRFHWQLVKPNGDVFIKGTFFGESNQSQQITKLVGFVAQD